MAIKYVTKSIPKLSKFEQTLRLVAVAWGVAKLSQRGSRTAEKRVTVTNFWIRSEKISLYKTDYQLSNRERYDSDRVYRLSYRAYTAPYSGWTRFAPVVYALKFGLVFWRSSIKFGDTMGLYTRFQSKWYNFFLLNLEVKTFALVSTTFSRKVTCNKKINTSGWWIDEIHTYSWNFSPNNGISFPFLK